MSTHLQPTIRRACAIAASLAAVAAAQSGQPTTTTAPTTMRAVRIHAYGGAEAMRLDADAPRPTPGAGEVLIRVRAAGVNPVDASLRAGRFGRARLPFTPGSDVAGVVESVGPDVSDFKPGDAVIAMLDLAAGGGYAEFAVCRASQAATKPTAITFEQAAALPLAASTAWQALVDAAKLDAGQTVLIHGGSGGVGAFAVQIAKARGARVIATASEANQAFLKELGADACVDYRAQRFEDVARDVDVVLDTVGGETRQRSIGVLRRGGTLVSIVGAPDRQACEAAGVRGVGLLVRPDGATLREIAALVDAGKLTPVVSETFPLAEAAAAHAQIETRHTRGKIVLRIAEDGSPGETPK